MVRSSYAKHILDFRKQLTMRGLVAEHIGRLRRKPIPDGVVVTGMGGSGLPGTILKAIALDVGLKVPVTVWKNYGLPRHRFIDPLYVFISFSGETEETVSGLMMLLAEGRRRRRKTGIRLPRLGLITTGGQLGDIGARHRLPTIRFSAPQLTAREGLGYTYYSLIKLLRTCFPTLRATDCSRSLDPKRWRRYGALIAKKVGHRIPLIYTDERNAHLGYIWKVNFNETAKRAAFSNVIPEMDHNELAMFDQHRGAFTALFLTDRSAPPQVNRKMELTEQLLRARQIPTAAIQLTGNSRELRTWTAVVMSHWAAFALAKQRQVDPAATPLIHALKALAARGQGRTKALPGRW